MKGWTRYVLLGAAALILYLFVFVPAVNEQATERRLAAHVATLSDTAYLDIGGVRIEVPLAAVDDYRGSGQVFTLNRRAAAAGRDAHRTEFRAATGNPESPMQLANVTLLIDTWGWDDFGHHDLYQRICPKLERVWARSVCNNPWSALQQSVPQRFHLLDRRYPEFLDRNSFAGGGTFGDQFRTLAPVKGRSLVACDPDRKVTGQNLCTAVRLLTDDLLAVWIVSADEDIQDLQKAGDAISALVTLGLGKAEQYEDLIALACDARRSGHSKPFRNEDRQCERD